MKKSKRRNSSLKTRRRRRSQKMWNMRGCASKQNGICAKCHHKCGRNGMCPICHHKCSNGCERSSRKKRGGASKQNRICAKRHLYDSHGVCKICGHHLHRRYTRGKRGGSPDAPVAYTGMGNGPSVPNPHYAYTGLQKGGGYVDIRSPLAPLNVDAIPQPPFVGAPWGAQISQWPGVSGPHDGSHLAHNSYDVQPEMNPVSERAVYIPQAPIIQQLGGRRRRNRKGRKFTKRRMRGGNFGFLSELGTNISNAYRGWNGEAALPSPLPYQDQMFFGRNAQDNLNYLKVG